MIIDRTATPARRFYHVVRSSIVLIFLLRLSGVVYGQDAPAQTDWPDFLGGLDSSQFSPLQQIDRTNIATLKQVWVYEFPDNAQSFGNPLVLEGRMYLPWSGGIVALDAATGRELWRHAAPGIYMRGLSSWLSSDGKYRRLFFSVNNRLCAIDAANGLPIRSFGADGSIDLREDLDRDPATIMRVESQSPGRVFENLIILGSTGGAAWDGPPGYIRAYDVQSGELKWTFHAIPHPGEPNYGGWPKNAWKTIGGVNNWTGMTIDAANGLLFVPFASANYNFYGANRAGDNLYANSLVAIDARTGKYIWHFQTVHHDLWDYDLPQEPKLLTLRRGDKLIEAVAVAGKTGFVYTFERKTGRPVFPIEERAVPQSTIEGERTSPTQPFPTAPPPFARQRFTVDDLSPYLGQEERESLRSIVSGMRNEGLFTPPSTQGSVAMPGTSGGTNWGNGVVDQRTGRLFLVSHEVPSILKLENPSDRTLANFFNLDSSPGEAVYAEHCASCHHANRKGQPPAIPSLVDVSQRLSGTEIQAVITRGRATMPGFALSEQALGELLEYLGYERQEILAADAIRVPPETEAQSSAEPSPIKYESGYNFLFSSKGLPASTPPWSMLTAYDMNNGTLLWQVPYGQLPGMPGSGTIFPRGGIVGTAGDLLIAGNQDRILRAWDMDSGEVLFETELPATPAGVPAVYQVDGREFVAIPAASYDPRIAKMAASGVIPEGRNSLVVYALPRDGQDNHTD